MLKLTLKNPIESPQYSCANLVPTVLDYLFLESKREMLSRLTGTWVGENPISNSLCSSLRELFQGDDWGHLF